MIPDSSSALAVQFVQQSLREWGLPVKIGRSNQITGYQVEPTYDGLDVSVVYYIAVRYAWHGEPLDGPTKIDLADAWLTVLMNRLSQNGIPHYPKPVEDGSGYHRVRISIAALEAGGFLELVPLHESALAEDGHIVLGPQLLNLPPGFSMPTSITKKMHWLPDALRIADDKYLQEVRV